MHVEAEVLEHHVSPTLLARMDRRLGHPRLDPHGDTIPSADGTVEAPPGRRFATLEPGDQGPLVRVDDDDPEMLSWLREQGIELGVVLELIARRPFGGPFLARVTGPDDVREIELGPELAEALWIDETGSEAA